MRTSITFLIILLILAFQPQRSFTLASVIQQGAERRIALVIGNGKYIHSPELANPVNDARSVREALQSVGFEVYEYENLTQAQIKQAIDDFGSRLKGYSTGLFFYAGHGIQSKGSNYLIPVDANIQYEQQIEYDCVQADRVLGLMEAAGSRVNIVILDACRNNPFERSWSRAIEGTGLAFMNAPAGSLIAYSTSPGRTASDGSGSNGLYTSMLLENIKTPDITILQMFQNVRRSVSEKSDKRQIPWESTSLTNDFYFVNPSSVSTRNEMKVSWKHAESGGFWFYLDNEEIAQRLNNDWCGKDLVVYDPLKNITCILKNYKESPVNQDLPAVMMDNSTNVFWLCNENIPSLYVKGKNIAARTKSVYVDLDVLIYDDQTNSTYILKDYRKNCDSKLRPAILFDNADYAFWRAEIDSSYSFYAKGEPIHDRTKSAWVDNDLLVYDSTTNITYLCKNYARKDDVLKLKPAQVISYQDNVFWQKKGNAYWLILKGEMISDRTTSQWSGEDLYVTDTKTNVTYIFPNYSSATENLLRPALVNPGK